MIEGTSDFCAECGFSLGKGEGSDTAVYQDLAQANLSRMRGDKQGAIDQCLKVLRAFPNNVTAHSLLGEIHMEHGELKQAAEWFEMALDLDPDATREKHLLHRVKKQMEDGDQKATLQQLEVKPRSGLTALWAGMVAIVLIVAAASFFIGRNAGGGKPLAHADKPAEPIRIPAEQSPNQPVTQPVNPAPETLPDDDKNAMTGVLAQAQKASLILGVALNPATEELTVTARVEDGVPLATTALLVSADGFVGRTSARSVVTRLVRAGKVVFVGTLTRSAYDSLQANTSQLPVDDLARQAFPQGWYANPEDVPTTTGVPNATEGDPLPGNPDATRDQGDGSGN